MCVAVRDRIAHGFLGDAQEVRDCFLVKFGTAAVLDKPAIGAMRTANIVSQGFERGREPGAVEADRAQSAREFAGLIDRLVQQATISAADAARSRSAFAARRPNSTAASAAIPASDWHSPSCNSCPRRCFVIGNRKNFALQSTHRSTSAG